MTNERYDLFELPRSGFPRRISSTRHFSEAKTQLDGLPDPEMGAEYLVRDFLSGLVVAYRAPHLADRTVVISPECSLSRSARPESKETTLRNQGSSASAA